MADTFPFSVENDDNVVSSDEDCLEFEEEEYDALNDETFGTLEDATGLDDWEEQHEQFAELAQSGKQSNSIENSLNKLVVHESNLYPTSKDSVWAYNENTVNGDVNNSSTFSPLKNDNLSSTNNKLSSSTASPFTNVDHNKVPTLEEIERAILKNRPKVPFCNVNVPPQHHGLAQIPLSHTPGRFPPGFPPPPPPPLGVPVPPPHLRHLHHGSPGMVRLLPPSHYMHPGGHPHGPTPPPGFFPPAPPLPMSLPFNFPLPMRLPPPHMHNMVPPQNMHHQFLHHNNNGHHNRNHSNNNVHHRRENYDPYAGLMSNREKQWLTNIQLVQLNTGTPYFDDFYYTIFKERKLKNAKENQAPNSERNRRQSIRRNSERENQNQLTPKVYTPLQFENSLGKLQCGSVTAPRKIIDMDVVTPDKDGEINSYSSRDTKRTKQLLLELETLYNYMLKAEDLKNPLYKSNIEKLFDIKQKQKLRELEVATTSEQKQDILNSLRHDSEPLDEDPQDYLVKVLHGLIQEDKSVSLLNIRKGRILLLRVLPHLNNDRFSTDLCDLWIKVFLSIPVVGRKDATGDNVFVRLYPFFKRFIQASDMDVILDIITNLSEVPSPNINRGTPVSCGGKQLLNFIISNKFGISALAAIFMRVEQLISLSNDNQKMQWFNFVISWSENLLVPKVVLETPIERISTNIFHTHCARISNLTEESRNLLEKRLTNCS